MRVLVTGGRDFRNGAMVRLALGQLPADAVLVHGAASGADTLSAEQWTSWGRTVEGHPAYWHDPCRASCRPGHRRGATQYDVGTCPAAGVYRNQKMLDSGIDLLVAFPGGRGTADMVRRCEQAGVPILHADKLSTDGETLANRSLTSTEASRAWDLARKAGLVD